MRRRKGGERMDEQNTPEHATVREVVEFKVEVERRFGRLEKLILGGIFLNSTIAGLLGSGKVDPGQVARLLQNVV